MRKELLASAAILLTGASLAACSTENRIVRGAGIGAAGGAVAGAVIPGVSTVEGAAVGAAVGAGAAAVTDDDDPDRR
jgi:hypothetical protein